MLAILVAVVIWLVVYAANLMKRQPQGDADEAGDSDTEEVKSRARRAIDKKNQEIEDLHRRLETEENKSADLGMELEKLKLEHSRLEDRIAQLREENTRLTRELQTPHPAAPVAPAAPAAPVAPERPPKPAAPEKPAAPIIKVIYLGRANARGIFVRADRRINAGNTIFRLDTNNGPSGQGCNCDDIEDVAGVTRIATESAGTAIFENGYWKVLRKTRIRYE